MDFVHNKDVLCFYETFCPINKQYKILFILVDRGKKSSLSINNMQM